MRHKLQRPAEGQVCIWVCAFLGSTLTTRLLVALFLHFLPVHFHGQKAMPKRIGLLAGLLFLRPEFSVGSAPVLFLSSAVPLLPM